jgi:hypothetical protein
MGYYPGGDRLLTDLCHYVRPADLTRSLLRHARTDPERAFAWGWATHVVADACLHPLINRGAAELARGRGTPSLTYAEDPVAHVRVEMGLDGLLMVRDGRPAGTAGESGRSQDILRCLGEAYQETYGTRPDPARLTASYRALRRFGPWLLALGRINGARLLGRRPAARLAPCRALVGLLSWTTSAVGRRSTFFALTHVAPPPTWLLQEATVLVQTFATRFLEHYASQLSKLPNWNLDTGGLCAEEPTYPPAAETRRRLGYLLARRHPQTADGLPANASEEAWGPQRSDGSG